VSSILGTQLGPESEKRPSASRLQMPGIHDRKPAGIAPETMNQRWKIEDNAKVKIMGICSDSSLTPEQKLDKIHAIDGQKEAEIAKLIPPKQPEAYNACRAGKNAASSAGKELGPCGGVVAPPGSKDAAHPHEHQMDHPDN